MSCSLECSSEWVSARDEVSVFLSCDGTLRDASLSISSDELTRICVEVCVSLLP